MTADMATPGSGGESVPDGVLRQEFLATLGRLDKLDQRLDALVTVGQSLQLSMVELRGAVMTRAETEAALEKRVSVEMFTALAAAAAKQRDEDLRALDKQRTDDLQDIDRRLVRVEGGAQRWLQWAGFALSAVAFLITASYFVVWLAQHASK